MGEITKIAWCDHTFNPWVGCTKISPACDHCYAESWARRTGHAELWNGERRRTTATNWQQPLKWNRAAVAARTRRRVFCASLADVFDNQVPPEWRRDLFDLIWETRGGLDWLLLTKRPQNIEKMLPPAIGEVELWPYPNVWLGTTVENQHEANLRIPRLLSVPARIRFLSCEPLLEKLDLWHYLDPERMYRRRIDWVIVGGEGGAKARPFGLSWAQSLVEQCASAKVACFMKQFGDRPVFPSAPGTIQTKYPCFASKGGDPEEWPVWARVRQFPEIAHV